MHDQLGRRYCAVEREHNHETYNQLIAPIGPYEWNAAAAVHRPTQEQVLDDVNGNESLRLFWDIRVIAVMCFP